MKRAAAAALVAIALATGMPAGADHLEHLICPSEPSREFLAAFEAPVDLQAETCAGTPNPWSDLRVGGWGGGDCPAGHVRRTPVVFVHGNGVDGWYFNLPSEAFDGSSVNVRKRFLDAGYCENELWAITYSGEATPFKGVAASFNTYNDINAEETYEFLLAVRDFTGSPRIDVVGHSLGVTVVRKAMFLHRNDPASTNPYGFVRRALMIAGANHGTTTCRGEEMVAALHVCEEVSPGSAWLTELNSLGEVRGPTEWVTLCECTGMADVFYLGMDALSPLLAGANDIRIPSMGHLELGNSEEAVATYLPLLLEGSAKAAASGTAKPSAPKGSTGGKQRVPATMPRRALPATGVGSHGAAAFLAIAGFAALLRRRTA